MKHFSKKGFTLVELILYVSMASVFLFTLSLFLSTLLSGRVKHQAITEVEAAGAHIVETIASAIRNAETITSPAEGGQGLVLQLGMQEVLQDPTIFQLTNQTITLQENGGATIDLHGSRIIPSNILFKNTSRENTPGIITFQFTLTHVNNGTNEFDYSETFYGSTSLR